LLIKEDGRKIDPTRNVEDNKGILNLVVDFYKTLFGFEHNLEVDLAAEFLEESEKVIEAQNTFLHSN
jgi:hypothetical protein